ncbi:MAG: hypothetical protein ACXADY_09075 [Candidatus Hodarchaeales archaeon]
MKRMTPKISTLDSILNTLPPQPGVYLNEKGKIFYIGADILKYWQ